MAEYRCPGRRHLPGPGPAWHHPRKAADVLTSKTTIKTLSFDRLLFWALQASANIFQSSLPLFWTEREWWEVLCTGFFFFPVTFCLLKIHYWSQTHHLSSQLIPTALLQARSITVPCLPQLSSLLSASFNIHTNTHKHTFQLHLPESESFHYTTTLCPFQRYNFMHPRLWACINSKAGIQTSVHTTTMCSHKLCQGLS